MDLFYTDQDLDRVDGRAKVTGKAQYAAEYPLQNMSYAVLRGSTIASGTITAIDAKAAERAPGVISVISHLNAPKVPGYDAGGNPVKGPTGGKGLQVFADNRVFFYGQPVAMVIADSYERAVHAASLLKFQYAPEKWDTELEALPSRNNFLEGQRYTEYKRGEGSNYKEAAVSVESEYVLPMEVHNPMELHATTVVWEGTDKVKVWDKTQGVKSTQRSIMQAFKLPETNVQVYAHYVGGGFGSALRTWPHVIAALIGAQKVARPLKLVLSREQMFTLVGYRPYTFQKIGIGASKDGKLQSIAHEAYSHTSQYEEFTEGTVNMSRFMYACPNVLTRYKVAPMNLSTPTWMRGPGEATGAFALESAIDELSYKLGLDPLQLRIINYAETDPQRNLPYSSKFLKEAYQLGAEKIGWNNRDPKPASMKEGEWMIGYGMGSGVFNASRGGARALARLNGDGSLLVQSAVADSGPGTATAMVQIASSSMGIAPSKVKFELGDSSLPPGPTQGGSTTTSTLGSAVHDAAESLKKRIAELLKDIPRFHTSTVHEVKPADLHFENGSVMLANDRSRSITFAELLRHHGLEQIEVTEESKPNAAMRNYAAYSYSVHFVKVKVHQLTGQVVCDRIVIAADAGTIVNYRTAESQMIGGAVGGIGMALMEEAVIDQRWGKMVNSNLADYHVPVQADVPAIDVVFVNKPDPHLNPMGAKGLGEIALIGFAAAVANAVFHATGKRIRTLPITPDKILA